MDERTPSFLFDVFRWPEHPELETIFERLWDEMPKSRTRKTVTEQKRCLRLFLCNLYVSHYYEKPIAISLRYEVFTRLRYRKLFIKRVPFNMVLKFLGENGLIHIHKGIKTYNKVDSLTGEIISQTEYEKGCETRIWPQESLRKEFETLTDVRIIKEADCITMRDTINKQKFEIDYPESNFTTNLRSKLEFINSNLAEYYFLYNSTSQTDKYSNPWYYNYNELFDIHHNDCEYPDPNNTLLREPNRVLKRFFPQIRVVFSNGSFESGGRLYAAVPDGIGNWQSMPQQQRRTILINNRPTVELDFDSFHITMLYATQGLQLDFDPYDTVAPKEMRPIIKKLLLTVLNADSEKSAVQSMQQQIRELAGKREVSQRELKFIQAVDNNRPDWQELIDALKEAHGPIRNYFCSGAGLALQRLDSEIMRSALHSLAEQHIPALPIHDSAIVAAHHERDLQEAMDLAYKSLFGADLHCGISKK